MHNVTMDHEKNTTTLNDVEIRSAGSEKGIEPHNIGIVVQLPKLRVVCH